MGVVRLILAYTVMLTHFHVFPSWIGNTSVCCFFVISGFYMQLIMADTEIKFYNFYLSRAFRIFPAYWLFALIDFCLAKEPHLNGFQVFSFLFIFGRDFLCLADACNVPVVPAWSLATELMFYLLAPVILRMPTLRIAGIALASLIGNILCMVLTYKKGGLWLYAVFPSVLCFFLAGSLAQRTYVLCRKDLFYGLMLLAGIVFLGIFLSISSFLEQERIVIIYYLLPLVICLLLPGLFYLSRYNNIDRWLGNLSYPVYLCHTVIGAWMIKSGHNNSLLIMGGITLVSILTYQFIDKPIDKLRHTLFGNNIKNPMRSA